MTDEPGREALRELLDDLAEQLGPADETMVADAEAMLDGLGRAMC